MTRSAQQDGNARPLARLEERHGHHLRAHQWEDTHDDSQGRNTLGHHIGIGGEKRSHLTGEQEDKQISYGHHRRGTSQGKLHDTPHTSIETGTNIEAHNRLQTLAKAHHHHDDEHRHTIHDTIHTHIHIAIGTAIGYQRTVDDDDDQAVAEIDTEGRKADGKNLSDDIGAHLQTDTCKMHEVGLVEEETELKDPGTYLSQHRCQSSSAHTPAKAEDEQGIEDDVHNHGNELGCHGLTRIARGSQLVVHTEEGVGDDVAGQDNLHIVVRIGQGGITGAKEPEDGVEEQQAKHRYYQADSDVEA